MADSKNTLRITAQYKKAIKEPNEFIKFALDDDDPYTWYIMVHNIAGSKDEYLGGEYIFKFILPKDFPYSPPKFYALTPNGLYDYNKICCISIGEFHKDDYRTSLGVAGFARELANGMIVWKDVQQGMNMLKTTYEEKKTIAKKSVEYNQKNNAKLLKIINDQYDLYSSKWDLKTITSELQFKLNL